MNQKSTIKETGYIYAESFKIEEALSAEGKLDGYKLVVTALPFGKVSSNRIMYNKESVARIMEDPEIGLVGRSFCDNHITDQSLRSHPPFGHVEAVWIDENTNSLMARVDIDPEEKDIVRKLKRKDISKVSIQVLGDSVMERFDEQGGSYSEASIGRFLELSLVTVPGFSDANVKSFEMICAESLRKKVHKEDVSTATAGDATAIGIAGAKKKEFVEPLPEDQADPKELAMGIEVEMEHTDDPAMAKKIALQHLAEAPDYYTKLKQVEGEKMNESLKENHLTQGDYAVDLSNPKKGVGVVLQKILGDDGWEGYIIDFNGDKVKVKDNDAIRVNWSAKPVQQQAAERLGDTVAAIVNTYGEEKLKSIF